MNKPSKKTTALVSIVLLAFVLVTGALLVHTENQSIKSAMRDFASYAKNNPAIAPSDLCRGGFINTDGNPALSDISNRIIENRILREEPREYAQTQDEAGISCLTSTSTWMLFSALNPDKKDGPDAAPHHCVDSTGKSGSYGIDRDNALCGE
ncbi:MAG TPA: hypothetical protein VGE35_02630 [Candidatus Paceibacterota bacterium]